MPYSDIILADRPLGYWSGPQVSRKNLLTDNQYSIETSTIGWTALDNTSISRVTTDAWAGNASIQIDPSSSSEAGFKISSGSRIELSYGRTYTMVARVKNVSGFRNARIRIEYFTTQNGSTLSEAVRLGQEFQVSSTEWTTIYHTETLPVGVSTNYFSSWGVVTGTGSSSDLIICDGIQFFEGTLYSMYDEQYSNDAQLRYLDYQESKPIIFGGEPATRLNANSLVEINNNYKLFINGSEDKPGGIEFWLTLETPPSSRHQLLKIGAFINVYIDNDKVYIDYLGNRDFVQINDWSRQHYISVFYSNKKITLHVDQLSTSLDIGSDFQFDRMLDFISTGIVIGPASSPYNLLSNPSFEDDNLLGWQSKNSSIQQISSDYFSGSKCLEVTKQATANSGLSYTNRINLKPYKKHFISTYVKIPTGQPSASLTLVCRHYKSFSDETELYSNSTTVLVSNNEWNRIYLEINPSIDDCYVEFELIQQNAGSAGSKFLTDSFLLEKSESLSTWSETLNDSDPMFISDIALYSYDIGNQKRNNRILYATTDDPDTMAIEYGADIINLNYSSDKSVYDINALIIDNSANVVIDNLLIGETGLSMPSLSTEEVEVGNDGGAATLNRNGIKFSVSSFLPLSQVDPYFNPISSTVRFQTVFDTLSGDGTALLFGGVYDSYGIALQKVSNKLRLINIIDPLLAPEVLFESTSIQNGILNIALNFGNQQVSAKIGNQEFNNISIPTINPGGGIILGNIPETSNAYPDYIRNLAVDSLTDFDEIDWLSTGRYMLRFIYDLNVSQRSEFIYTTSTPESSSNSIISFNTASENSVYVNGSQTKEISNIPGFNYSVPEPIETRIILESDNSASDRKTINNVYLSIFDSSNIVSSLSNFSLKHNILFPDTYDDLYVDIYGGELKNAFVMNVIPSNTLSHDDNLGIKFNKLISTGARVVCNSSSYEMLEIVFKINMYPNKSEKYTIFDVAGVNNINLSFTDQGLVKNGTYQLFIDGQLISNLSNVKIHAGEMYHVAVKFDASMNYDVHIGCSKNVTDKMDGTIGKLNIYEVAPSNLSQFIEDKYSDLIGRLTKKVDADSIIVNDSSVTQEYIRDSLGEYYEMKNLPKVKIVSEI
jgi:hypothetical protein